MSKDIVEKTARERFQTKSKIEDLPLKFEYGSSSHNPDENVAFETCDIVLWVCFAQQWFRPYGGFNEEQIKQMIEVCSNDQQVVALFNLLSANEQRRNGKN